MYKVGDKVMYRADITVTGVIERIDEDYLSYEVKWSDGGRRWIGFGGVLGIDTIGEGSLVTLDGGGTEGYGVVRMLDQSGENAAVCFLEESIRILPVEKLEMVQNFAVGSVVKNVNVNVDSGLWRVTGVKVDTFCGYEYTLEPAFGGSVRMTAKHVELREPKIVNLVNDDGFIVGTISDHMLEQGSTVSVTGSGYFLEVFRESEW